MVQNISSPGNEPKTSSPDNALSRMNENNVDLGGNAVNLYFLNIPWRWFFKGRDTEKWKRSIHKPQMCGQMSPERKDTRHCCTFPVDWVQGFSERNNITVLLIRIQRKLVLQLKNQFFKNGIKIIIRVTIFIHLLNYQPCNWLRHPRWETYYKFQLSAHEWFGRHALNC